MANKVELAGAAGADNSSSAPIFVSNALFGASASFTPTAASYNNQSSLSPRLAPSHPLGGSGRSQGRQRDKTSSKWRNPDSQTLLKTRFAAIYMNGAY